MALLDKPDMREVWASGGAAVKPSDEKIQTGWTAEVPPYQYENWIQGRQDQYLAHVNQRGIPQWDGTTEYEGGGVSYAQGSDGVVYKSVGSSGPSGTVQNPVTDVGGTYWEKAFADNTDNRIANAVPSVRTITAGDGLSGGGTLAANRTLSVDDTVVRTTRSITAGTGLSGGGTLAANRTLSVNYGTTAGTAAQGNDSRIVNAVPNTRTVTAGTGLSGGGTLASNRTLSVNFATAAQAKALTASNVAITPATLGSALDEVSQKIVVFDTPGVHSWAVPDILKNGKRKARVTVIGGGGGGGNMVEDDVAGGGGGGGGAGLKIIDLTGITTVPITVGLGGSGAPSGSTSSGTPGESSSFGSYLSCGGGGDGSTPSSGGAGLSAGADVILQTAAASAGASARSTAVGGSGGGSGGAGVVLTSRGVGEDGRGPGGGGAGGGGTGVSGGGSGAAGIVIIEW